MNASKAASKYGYLTFAWMFASAELRLLKEHDAKPSGQQLFYCVDFGEPLK